MEDQDKGAESVGAPAADSIDPRLEHAVTVAHSAEALREALDAGADPNAPNRSGEYPLALAVETAETPETRYALAEMLLQAGAHPSGVDPDGLGPLFSATLNQDTAVLRLLLDHGADPELEHVEGEGLLNWAIFDYCYEAYFRDGLVTSLPEEPPEEAKETTDTWIAYLDDLAVRRGAPRPECLKILRAYGARER